MKNKLFGLTGTDKQKIINLIRNRNLKNSQNQETELHSGHQFSTKLEDIPEEYYKIEHLPGLKQLQIQLTAAEKFGIANPFFRVHGSVASSETTIGDKTYINYSSYNYLGLCGHPKVSRAAKDAIDRYGTSVS